MRWLALSGLYHNVFGKESCCGVRGDRCRIGHLIFAELVQATGDSTGGRARVCRGDNTAEQMLNVPLPQILEQNVEVIKVVLQDQCHQLRFFF